MQEVIGRITELAALVGFNEPGYQTAIVICTKDKVEEACKMLYEQHPDLNIVSLYDVQLSAKRNASYVMDANKQLHKTY